MVGLICLLISTWLTTSLLVPIHATVSKFLYQQETPVGKVNSAYHFLYDDMICLHLQSKILGHSLAYVTQSGKTDLITYLKVSRNAGI